MYTALEQPVQLEVNVVRYLLDHNARADIKDGAGRTPIETARGSEIAELLRGASRN